MSAVLWNTRDHGQAVLQGSERAHARSLAVDMAWGIVQPAIFKRETLLPYLVDPPPYLTEAFPPEKTLTWLTWVRIWLQTHVRDEGSLWVDGEAIPFGELALNTLIGLNRPLRLMAWLQGLCESHGYFEPDAHGHLQRAIEEGRAAGIMRDAQGWEDVLALVERVEGKGPIVWSYTVTDDFPDPGDLVDHSRREGESDEDFDDRIDAAYEMPSEEAWDRCMERLRDAEWPVALDPDIEQGFLSGKTAFDFQAQLWRDKPWVRGRK